MRSFKAKRKLLEISLPSSPVQDNNSNLSNNRKVVWIPTDSNDPKSPISVEYLPLGVKRKFSKAKTKKNSKRNKRMNKNIPSNSSYPFFIDKTPTAVKRKKRCLDMNDSVILLDTPSTSNKAPVESDAIISLQTKKLVDTVDLCSDSEDEIETPNIKCGQKRKRTITTLPLDESVLELSSPDIIILDEDNSDKKEEKNNSVVVKPTSDPLVSSISLSERVTNSKPDSTSFIGFSLNSSNFPVTSFAKLCKSKAPEFSNNFAQSKTFTNLPSSTSVSNTSNLPVPPDFIPIPCSSNSIPSKATSGKDNKSIPSNVGSNVFNPNSNVEQTGLRPIIIDGSNVAIAHGGDQMFSVRGLCICVEYFLRRGHTQVLALVPLHQRCKVSPQDRHILDCLQKDKHLVFTPSRYIGKQLISSYDDRFIVQYAAAVGGVIVSRDNYRDLLGENPAWKDTILERLLMPTWVGDMLMFPVDPMGKKGPNLDEFLRFPKK